LTIPTLLQNTNQAELKTAYKKDFGMLQQAMLMLVNDSGGNLFGKYSGTCNTDESCISNEFTNYMKNYLSFIKTCNVGQSQNCWYSQYRMLGNDTPYATATSFSDQATGILSNGSLIAFRINFKHYGYFRIDVNGYKKPNTMGKDMFYIKYDQEGRVMPFPNNVAGHICDASDPTTTGYGCAELYLYQ